MFYYKHIDRTLASRERYDQFVEISEDVAASDKGNIFILTGCTPENSRRSFSAVQSDLVSTDIEDLNMLLLRPLEDIKLPAFISQAVLSNRVTMVNTEYPTWQDVLLYNAPEKWRINVVGLGDVGGTLVSGLRLLGGDCISHIGIYDIDPNKIKRWEYETNQIMDPTGNLSHPGVLPISKEQLFDCDMFIFCVTVGVPTLSESPRDVRIAQYEGNSKIMKDYVLSARSNGFKGIFAVVSDPVDLLCKAAFNFSNTDNSGRLDFKGLAAEQIRGYGLGVMHARAAYFAGLNPETAHYLKEGRAFGPHGEGLIIADSIEKYNESLSLDLTEKTKTANLVVRSIGFKPYVAPALSSGSLSILATIRGQWHYSATFLGGVYWGTRNRMLPSGTELERMPIPDGLFRRMESTYESLRKML